MYAISTQEALELVTAHEQCTLPKEKWTHEAHLIVGLYVVLHYGKNAFIEMKRRVWQYNELKGRGNKGTGFHTTLTLFWVWAVRQFCAEKKITAFDEVSLDELLFDENLADRKLIEAYYDEVLIYISRNEYILSDLKPMPDADCFLLH